MDTIIERWFGPVDPSQPRGFGYWVKFVISCLAYVAVAHLLTILAILIAWSLGTNAVYFSVCMMSGCPEIDTPMKALSLTLVVIPLCAMASALMVNLAARALDKFSKTKE